MLQLFLFVFISQNALVGSLVTRGDCLPSTTELQCKQLKCNNSPRSIPNCLSIVSGYIGGNQCCDNTVIKLLNSLPLKTGRKKRQAFDFSKQPQAKWSLPIVYYPNFNTQTYITAIQAAVQYIQSQTCISFVFSTSQPTVNYMNFTLSSSCTSFVGKTNFTSSPILGTSDCFSEMGQVLHLMTQSLGIWHQSQRNDSSKYITINYNNMGQEFWSDFIPLNSFIILEPIYDHASIMQYPAKQFTSNGNFTIVPLNLNFLSTIGQRAEYSFLDSKMINSLYCNGACRTQLNCLNGGYTDPKVCTSCRCPDGFSGALCQLVQSLATSVYGNQCGGELIASTTQQLITIPGYLIQEYPTNINCIWKINAPEAGTISLSFKNVFSVYQDPYYACQHWVEIRYTNRLNETGIRYCGTSTPTDQLKSMTNTTLVIFKSNYLNPTTFKKLGFSLSYMIVIPPTVTPPTVTPSTLTTAIGCQIIGCLNGGSCIENQCVCQIKYQGTFCEKVINSTGNCKKNGCQNGGSCINNNCVCTLKYQGTFCETPACGGCNNVSGISQKKCIQYVIPKKLCTKLVQQKNTFGFWCYTTMVNVTYPCIEKEYCCDNAVGLNGKCVVEGWTDWSTCSSKSSKGIWNWFSNLFHKGSSKKNNQGVQTKSKYVVESGQYIITDTVSQNCIVSKNC